MFLSAGEEEIWFDKFHMTEQLTSAGESESTNSLGYEYDFPSTTMDESSCLSVDWAD